jgi:SOS-response transcriptional repressor LexA
MRNATCEAYRMDLDTPGDRLKWARKNRSAFATATDAAKAFGWTVPTYLGHENGDRIPSRKAAIKYATAYKVPWAWILEGGPLPGSRQQKTGPIPTKGEVAAGQWLDLDVEMDPRDFEQFPIAADPAYPHDAQYGLIVRGNSMNRVFDSGEVLHCLDVLTANVEPEENDIVIVERVRAQAGQREVTAKRITKRGKLIVLAPDSTESKWKPIEFNPQDGHDGEEEVRVVAVVLATYRPIRRRK